jgi:hypothetical protein
MSVMVPQIIAMETSPGAWERKSRDMEFKRKLMKPTYHM